MGLTRYKLGDLIEKIERRNTDLAYDAKDVRGISNNKTIQATKADISDRNFAKFQIVQKGEFCFNRRTTRMGDKIGLGFNTGENFIITEDYIVFRVMDNDILLPDFLFIFFNRPEFDRYARWDSWGSATEFFNWEEMCNVPIQLPSREIQQKYVDIYLAMKQNQQCYERGLEDLKLTCDGYIEELRRNMDSSEIRPHIRAIREKNTKCEITLEQGINIEKKFINPQRTNSDLSSRIIVRTGQFAYCTQLNNEKVAISYRRGCDCVVSPVYAVFEIIDENILLPEYLFLWLTRSEFGRYVYWASEGSAYEFLRYENLASSKIPVPELHIQQDIVNIYKAYEIRREISEKLKEQMKNICPILVKGAVEEGAR